MSLGRDDNCRAENILKNFLCRSWTCFAFATSPNPLSHSVCLGRPPVPPPPQIMTLPAPLTAPWPNFYTQRLIYLYIILLDTFIHKRTWTNMHVPLQPQIMTLPAPQRPGWLSLYRTCIYTYTHTYTQTHTYTHTHTYLHILLNTFIHKCTWTHMPVPPLPQIMTLCPTFFTQRHDYMPSCIFLQAPHHMTVANVRTVFMEKSFCPVCGDIWDLAQEIYI